MADGDVTEQEAVDTIQVVDREQPLDAIDYDYLMELRSVTLAQLAVYERRLGLSPTTSERLLWLKRRGPDDSIIIRQVAHIKACERG